MCDFFLGRYPFELKISQTAVKATSGDIVLSTYALSCGDGP
jgi:hypothetical protein